VLGGPVAGERAPVLGVALAEDGARGMASSADSAEPWLGPVRALAERIAAVRAGVDSPVPVRVLYQASAGGRQRHDEDVWISPQSADGQLIVHAAVPAGLPPDPAEVLLSLLRDAVELAERYALQHEIAARPLAELRALLAALEQD
jgi:hypothetical protein